MLSEGMETPGDPYNSVWIISEWNDRWLRGDRRITLSTRFDLGRSPAADDARHIGGTLVSQDWLCNKSDIAIFLEAAAIIVASFVFIVVIEFWRAAKKLFCDASRVSRAGSLATFVSTKRVTRADPTAE